MLFHPGAGWHIRPFEPDDALECDRVFDTCQREFSWLVRRSAVPRSYNPLGGRWATFVAEVEPVGVIGFIMVDCRSAYVSYILVDPDWRLCGVGRGLLDVARNITGRPLCLDVDAENVRARAAYGAFGFNEMARWKSEGRQLVRLRGA